MAMTNGAAPDRSVTGSTPSASEPNWTDQVTDLVVDVVDSVRDKTTGPILKGARGVVYGTVAFIVLFVVGIVGLIGVGRALEMVPGDVWICYLVLGVLFTLGGFVMWGKRFAP